MTTATDDASQAAYAQHRAEVNARWRWLFAVPLLATAVAIILAHLLSGSVAHRGMFGVIDGHALAFAYLGAVALIGLLGGRKPRVSSPRLRVAIDAAWIALLMPGAAALATLDAPVGDLTGFVMLCLPAAIFHSAGAFAKAMLQSLGLAGAVAGILLHGSLAPPASGGVFLATLAACSAVFVYIGAELESMRRREYLSARELELRSNELAEHSEALEAANARLQALAGTDPLTGVANRRQLYEAMDREFGRARRFGNALAIALIDLDDFGPINKMHGVIAGDEVLVEFAAALRSRLRSIDVVARYGGEEFVVLMPDCGGHHATQLMERVRMHIAATPLSTRHIALTFSAGVAELTAEDADPATVLHRADAALRQAKAEGKNRVALA